MGTVEGMALIGTLEGTSLSELLAEELGPEEPESAELEPVEPDLAELELTGLDI